MMKPRLLVVGAGAVGCMSALAMVARGWEVVLADKGVLGGESSWAGGGILFPLLPWDYPDAVTRLVLEGAARHGALCASLLEDTGIDPQYMTSGLWITGAVDVDRAFAWCRAHAVEARACAGGIGIELPGVAQVRNPRLMQALKALLLQRGVHILEHMPLAGYHVAEDRITGWECADGRRLEADVYLLTAGAWSRQLLGADALGVRIEPVRGQMLLYRLAPGVVSQILYRDGIYLIPRQDGHILVGSTLEAAGFDKSVTAEAATSLAAAATALLPQLAGAPIVRHWSGLRPGSPGNIPVTDRHPWLSNLYLNAGHFRYGVTMAPASAEQIAALMDCGQATDATSPYAYRQA